MCNMFGGPSSEEEGLAGQESNLSQDLLANYKEQYAQRGEVLKQLSAEISRIQSGNTGPGFGGAENAALISDIQNKGAAAARNAIQAEQDRAAGQGGGGTSSLQRSSAIRQQVDAAMKTGAEINTANALNAETEMNYRQGRENAARTASGLQSLAGMYTPEAYASGASSATQSAFNMADKIQKEKAERAAAIGGLAMKGLSLATGGVTGALSAGGGFLDTLKGAAGGALGQDFLTNPTPASQEPFGMNNPEAIG